MKIVIDKNLKVKATGCGDISQQQKELKALLEYLQKYAVRSADFVTDCLQVDPTLVAENKELKKQLQNAERTLQVADKALKEKRNADKN